MRVTETAEPPDLSSRRRLKPTEAISYFQRRIWGTLFIATGLLLILSAQCLRSESHLNSLVKTLTWFYGLYNPSQGGVSGDFAKLFLAGIWLLPPLFTVAAITLVSCARRQNSLCTDIVNGFRRGVFAAGCLLALMYGGLVIYSVRLENRVNYAFERTLVHEGRFVAELSGQQWLP